MPASEPRELRLEGGVLWFAVALLLSALAGAFALGRWTAPQAPSGSARPSAGTESGAVLPPADVDAGAAGFDVGGVPEPGRQTTEPPPEPPPTADPAPSSGPWHVQVFAGRDRQAAEKLVVTLKGAGWPVRMQSLQEGSGSLLKVRVGGYPTRAEAEAAAARLRSQGQTGAWVTASP